MSIKPLPGGGTPWFERRRSPWSYNFMPVSFAGWAVIAVYVLFAIGISLLFFGGQEEPPLAAWAGWASLLGVATLFYSLTLLRMSAAESDPTSRRRNRARTRAGIGEGR